MNYDARSKQNGSSLTFSSIYLKKYKISFCYFQHLLEKIQVYGRSTDPSFWINIRKNRLTEASNITLEEFQFQNYKSYDTISSKMVCLIFNIYLKNTRFLKVSMTLVLASVSMLSHCFTVCGHISLPLTKMICLCIALGA